MPTPRGEKLVDALAPSFSFLDYEFTKTMEEALDDVANGKLTYVACRDKMNGKLVAELEGFKERHVVPCPECGDSDGFRYLMSQQKGYNYWACKACGSTFDDAQGRPGAKREKPAMTDFSCEKCGQPLQHVKGEKTSGLTIFLPVQIKLAMPNLTT